MGSTSAASKARLRHRSFIAGIALSWLLLATMGSQAPADAASGATYVGRVASKTSSTSAGSASVATTRQVAAGDSLILAILLSSGPATGAVSITDPAGNQYSIDRDQPDGTDGDRLVVASARTVAPIATGAIITVTFPTYAEYHISIDEFAGVVAPDRSASGWATSSSFNSGSTATTTQATDLLFGVVGNESGAVSTFAAGWTALPSLDISSDHLRAGYQLTTAPGSFAATGATGGTWMAAVVAYTTQTGPPPEAPPSAALGVSPGSGLAPLQVSADASGSTDTDATPIATYDFAWGDGTPATGPQPGSAAQHTFASPGTYTVTVTVKDTAGLSSTATQSIAANSDLAPTPALSVTPNPVAVQFPVQADASRSKDTDGTPIATYSFSWGDGTPATGPQSSSTAQHTYAAVGSFKVKVTLKDTGGLSSTATKAVTVSPDAAPVAKLRVTKSSSNPMQITADGSTSTDTDATPIGSYRFDFGDGTAVVTTHAPSAKATHTYANAGTFTVTLTVLDTAGNVSAPVTASVSVSSATGSGIAVYAGYYDTHHSGHPQPKPSPWGSSLFTVFVGKPDTSSGGWDASAVRVDNLSGVNMNSVVVTVDIGSSHFSLWGTHALLPGQSLVLTQTAFENFDGSDKNKAGCYDCDPSLCTTARYTTIPVVHVTVDGKTTVYNDTAQVLNTRGADSAGCPYTGTRNDESTDWKLLG